MQLVRQAVRESWSVPEATRTAIVDGMTNVLRDHIAHHELDDNKRVRLSLSIIRTMLDMTTADQLLKRDLPSRRLLLRRKSSRWKAWAKPFPEEQDAGEHQSSNQPTQLSTQTQGTKS